MAELTLCLFFVGYSELYWWYSRYWSSLNTSLSSRESGMEIVSWDGGGYFGTGIGWWPQDPNSWDRYVRHIKELPAATQHFSLSSAGVPTPIPSLCPPGRLNVHLMWLFPFSRPSPSSPSPVNLFYTKSFAWCDFSGAYLGIDPPRMNYIAQ